MSFSLARFFSLVKRDFIIYKKPVIYLAIGLILIMGFLSWIGYASQNITDFKFWFTWFLMALMGGGLLLTSVAFWEFKSPAGRIQYLSLPASNLEKFATRHIYTLIVYPFLILSLFTVLYMILSSFYPNISIGSEDRFMIKMFMKTYVLAHSVVIICGIYFNKYVAPKTMITGWAIFFISLLIGLFLVRIIFHDMFSGFFQKKMDIDVTMDAEFQEWLEIGIQDKLNAILLNVLPIFFWVVAYFKMKEKEV